MGIEQQIENKLAEIGDAYIKPKKIILFGAGGYSRQLYRLLKEKGYSVHTVIDNNGLLEGHLFLDIVIQYAEDFLNRFDGNNIFLVLSRFYQEIKSQLEGYGYVENVHFFKMAEIDSIDEWHIVDEEKVGKCIADIRKGKAICDMVADTYGVDVVLLVNPVASIGDVYLMSFYLNAYLKDNPNCVFLFKSRVLKKLAEELDFGTVLYMEPDCVQAVIEYAKVFGFEKVNVKLLHTGYVHFRIWSRMLTYVGITWMEHYKELFEVSDEEGVYVRRLESEIEVEKCFIKYGLAPGKTVVLSPYANTVRQFPDEFWHVLARRLQALGYSVCTNIGSAREKEIPGTIPVHIEVENICNFVEYAGVFVGIRSGLCDLLCTCECLKIILYSDEVFDLIPVYDFYSLEKMGYGKNVLEYVVENGNKEKILEDILMKINMYARKAQK